MQSTSLNMVGNTIGGPQPPQRPGHSTSSSSPASLDDLARVFNTAVIASRAESNKNLSGELSALMSNPAFQAILSATRDLAAKQGIPERKAAESIIQTFRKLEQIWGDYVFSEGIEKLRRTKDGA